eukprot:361985-Chlamydomonas_euryale.AAC.4
MDEAGCPSLMHPSPPTAHIPGCLWHRAARGRNACKAHPSARPPTAHAFNPLPHHHHHQAVFGIERLVDVTLAKRIPAPAYPPLTPSTPFPTSTTTTRLSLASSGSWT